MTKYFHGGYGGLSVGQFILPPHLTKAPTTASYGARGICDPTKIYVTTIFDAAVMFACAHPSGRGKVYEVEPVGTVSEDHDAKSPGFSYECSRAKVTKVYRVKGKTIKRIQKYLLEDA